MTHAAALTPQARIALGSCPTCGGPAQFIDEAEAAAAAEGLTPVGSAGVRHVELPNIEEDLGDGWRLRGLYNHGLLNPPWRRWEAQATNQRPDQARAFGATPQAAYLALRAAIAGVAQEERGGTSAEVPGSTPGPRSTPGDES